MDKLYLFVVDTCAPKSLLVLNLHSLDVSRMLIGEFVVFRVQDFEVPRFAYER